MTTALSLSWLRHPDALLHSESLDARSALENEIPTHAVWTDDASHARFRVSVRVVPPASAGAIRIEVFDRLSRERLFVDAAATPEQEEEEEEPPEEPEIEIETHARMHVRVRQRQVCLGPTGAEWLRLSWSATLGTFLVTVVDRVARRRSTCTLRDLWLCLHEAAGTAGLGCDADMAAAVGVVFPTGFLSSSTLVFVRGHIAATAHFVQALRMATMMGRRGQNAAAICRLRLLAEGGGGGGGARGLTDLRATWWLAAAVREWYFHFHESYSEWRESGTLYPPRQTDKTIRSASRALCEAACTAWTRDCVPAFQEVLRRHGAAASGTTAAHLAADLQHAWTTTAALQPAITRLAATRPRAALDRVAFQWYSPGLLSRPADAAALRAFLGSGGGGGGAWRFFDMDTSREYAVDTHLRAVGGGKSELFELWIDDVPAGYLSGSDVPRAFLRDVREVFRRGASCASDGPDGVPDTGLLARATVAVCTDWLRRRCSLHTCAGRLGEWLRPTGSSSSSSNIEGSTFATAVRHGLVEWVDLQTEQTQVHVGRTHEPLQPHWRDWTLRQLSVCVPPNTQRLRDALPGIELFLGRGGGGGEQSAPLPSARRLDDVLGASGGGGGGGGGVLWRCWDPRRRAGWSDPLLARESAAAGSRPVTVGVLAICAPTPSGVAATPILLNAAAVQRGLFAHALCEPHVLPVEEEGGEEGGWIAHVPRGTFVRRGDVLATYRRPDSDGTTVTRATLDGFVWSVSSSEIVVGRMQLLDGCTDSVAMSSPVLWSRGARTAFVVARLVPEHRMPFDAATGCRPDMLVSPLDLHHLEDWMELTALCASPGATDFVDPDSAVADGSTRWWLSELSLHLSRSSTAVPELREEATASTTVLAVDSRDGRLVSPTLHTTAVVCDRTWAREVLQSRWLELGLCPRFITEAMRPAAAAQGLLGRSRASCALLRQAYPSRKDRRAVRRDAARMFRQAMGLPRDSSSSSDSDSDSDSDSESEKAKVEAKVEAKADDQEPFVQRALTPDGSSTGGGGGSWPRQTFQFDAYWRRTVLRGDTALRLQEQSRAQVRILVDRFGAEQTLWKESARGTQFLHALSGAVVPFLDPHTLFLLQRGTKFAGGAPGPACKAASMDADAGAGAGAGAVPLEARRELQPGLFEAGDRVLWLQDVTMPARLWTVLCREADSVYTIRVEPSQPVDGLTQTTQVVLATQIWHASHGGVPTGTNLTAVPPSPCQVPQAPVIPSPTMS